MKFTGVLLRLISLAIAFALLGTLAIAAGAQEQISLDNDGCTSGGNYNPACDVNHSGTIDVNDIQLTAGHWNEAGTWASDNIRDHVGQTWEDDNNAQPGTLHQLFIPLIDSFPASDFQPCFRISADSTAHADYGLAYPVTYQFRIPPGSSSLRIYRRFEPDGQWTLLAERTGEDFFNGIEAVRFDYTADKVFVSVAFGAESDDIYLTFVDPGGTPVPAVFEQITRYYDARAAAVVVTGDDEADWSHQYFHSAYEAFTEARIWFTSAINTGMISGPGWADIQTYIDQGYVEPACHSRTHPWLPYPDYDSEVGGCSSDIKEHLNPPFPKGSTEYVAAYIDPYGLSDSMLRSKLSQYGYLAERSVEHGVHTFAAWSETDGLFERIGLSICGDNRGSAFLNSLFDTVGAQHGIYHLYIHPWRHDWSEGSAIRRHIDHIKGRKDIWYAGFGHLYTYHYVQERGMVTVTALEITGTGAVLVNFCSHNPLDPVVQHRVLVPAGRKACFR
ncbi:MAG: hypothetical protein U9R25_13820 [Chloroflexota bacterium]|nr:hypothetical protein [Chloroflexota bacterium]